MIQIFEEEGHTMSSETDIWLLMQPIQSESNSGYRKVMECGGR
jgi:hypothetical protein